MLRLVYVSSLLRWRVFFGDAPTDIDGYFSFESLDEARMALRPLGLSLIWTDSLIRKVVLS